MKRNPNDDKSVIFSVHKTFYFIIWLVNNIYV